MYRKKHVNTFPFLVKVKYVWINEYLCMSRQSYIWIRTVRAWWRDEHGCWWFTLRIYVWNPDWLVLNQYTSLLHMRTIPLSWKFNFSWYCKLIINVWHLHNIVLFSSTIIIYNSYLCNEVFRHKPQSLNWHIIHQLTHPCNNVPFPAYTVMHDCWVSTCRLTMWLPD